MPVKTFDCGFFAYQGHDDFTVRRCLLRMHEDIIAIQNMSAFHAIALNLQQEGACRSPLFRKLNRILDIFLRQQWDTGCHSSHYGNAGSRVPIIGGAARRNR